MELKTYKFSLEELDLDPDIIAGYMGYPGGAAPEPIPQMIEDVLAEAPEYAEITAGYIIRDDIVHDKKKKTLRIGDEVFNLGRFISSRMRKAVKVAIAVTTAGQKFSDWSKRLMAEGDMMKGYIVDVTGSEVVDRAMEQLLDIILSEYSDSGMKVTDAYNPGYCDWPVGEQKKLFSFLPENFCGVSLSESSLMHPVKSLSGLIGIAPDVKRTGYMCYNCPDMTCIYRNKRLQKKSGEE